ncbi:hypothetical protein BJ122_13217 [Rhodopseudomonas faecalis]|uniref:Uncharacterized protein n=1 Tax=Rhodopseudomonas faecalis TaxID=99655 RepID=A0A318T8D1_9BRAD|nr:hypothetical protein [Rhodopseudomonas faecalis]PYE99997.1 hypothetical protein BJ122_13217 [Rhodopseudomonas faecalis]TAH64898.1 MAG: hypothetical protein EWM45_17015 [Rhodopseudomonas palustris]
MPHQGAEQRVAALLEQESSIKQWLDQIGALGRDHRGHIVVRGLSVEEAEEFLRLRPLVQAPDSGLTQPGLAQATERYGALRSKLEAALQEEAIARLSSWGGH